MQLYELLIKKAVRPNTVHTGRLLRNFERILIEDGSVTLYKRDRTFDPAEDEGWKRSNNFLTKTFKQTGHRGEVEKTVKVIIEIA